MKNILVRLAAIVCGVSALAACTTIDLSSADTTTVRVGLTPEPQTFEATGGTYTGAVVVAQGMEKSVEWTASIDGAPSWITLSSGSKESDFVGTYADDDRKVVTDGIVLSVEPNETFEKRSAVLRFSVADGGYATFTITQKGAKKPVDPTPDEPVVDGMKTPEEFLAFLEAAADATDADVFKIGQDINLGGVTLSPVSSFEGVLDGQGHKIYNYTVESASSQSGLFLINKGTIKNIIFGSSDGASHDGVSKVGFASSITSTSHIGGVVSENEGTLQNVANFATVVSPLGTSALTGIGGIAGIMQTGGLIDGCTNGAQLSVSGTMGAETYFAGVVAYVNNADAVVSNCKNIADITIGCKIAKASMFGGIVGRANLGAQIEKCTNSGDITYDQAVAPSTYMMIAGVAGATYTGSCTTDCVNEGNVTTNLMQVSRAGGIVGTLNSGGVISGCVNNGNVTIAHTASNGNWQAAAGICGFQEKGSGNAIRNCTNNANVTVAVENATTHANKVAAGGIIGTAALALEVSNCTNNGSITGSNKSAGAIYVGGIGGFLRAGAGIFTEKCTNTGAVTATTSDNSESAAGGIVANSAVATNTHTGDKNTGSILCTNAAATGAIAGINLGTITNPVVGGKVNGLSVDASNIATLTQGSSSTGSVAGAGVAQ